MKIYSIVLTILLLSLASSVTATTIDSNNRYVWSENAGWIDFGSDTGYVTVGDGKISGYAYAPTIGWISIN